MAHSLSERQTSSLAAPGVDPISAAFRTLIEAGEKLEKIEQVYAMLERLLAGQEVAALREALADGLHPDHLYNTKQAAQFLGLTPGSANNIPHDLLPHEGGKWRGIDIMAYRGDISYEAATLYKEAKRAPVLRLVKPDGVQK